MDFSLPGSSLHGDSPGKNTGVGCHTLLQGIFPTQGSSPGLPPCRWILCHLNHQGSLEARGQGLYPKPCMSFQPSGQVAPFNEEQLSQQQPTLLASGGAWVLTGDLSGAQQCPLQSLHHLKNPAQGLSPERCSIVCGLGARFSSLCDTILLFILSGRSLSLPLSPLLLLPAGV